MSKLSNYNEKHYNSIFLNSLTISNLEGGYFYKEFIKNHNVKPLNVIEVSTEEEANMWSTFIEIISCISCHSDIPEVEGNWSIIIEYSTWDYPVHFFNKSSAIIQVKIKCENGIISEEANEISSEEYILIPNDDHGTKELSKLKQVVIDDLERIAFYRWNPRIYKDSICDFQNHFLLLHDQWCAIDKFAYEEEVNGILTYLTASQYVMKSTEFDTIRKVKIEEIPCRLEAIIINSGNSVKKQYRYMIYKDFTDNAVDVRGMEDDFQNFFYSYAEFKKFKDNTTGAMGMLMLDVNTELYFDIYKKQIPNNCESQFFFIKWKK